jgi:hypothetical protein
MIPFLITAKTPSAPRKIPSNDACDGLAWRSWRLGGSMRFSIAIFPSSRLRVFAVKQAYQ